MSTRNTPPSGSGRNSRPSSNGPPATAGGTSNTSAGSPPQQQQNSNNASSSTTTTTASSPPRGQAPNLENNNNPNVPANDASPPAAQRNNNAAAPPTASTDGARGAAPVPTTAPPAPPAQHQQQQQAAATTATTASTVTTTGTTTAAAAPAPVASDQQVPAASAAAATAAPQQPPTAPASASRIRPAIQLTQNLAQTYHENNEKIFQRRRLEQPAPRYNDGYDDSQGHYIVMQGEEIIQRYQVLETLGRGSFGTVVRAYDTRRKEVVAAKITRSGSGFRNQAKLEIDILMKILTQAPDSKTVRILKAFDWRGHLVIVFELLSFNLYQLMQCTNYHGVSLDLTSKFAFQLLMVLRDLERLNPPVIHCDMKPENVLLVNQNRSAIRVIDFGSACYQNRRMFRYIQSRYYRSPEVILQLEYGTAIDRWSLGCILVELHTGVALFDGRNEAQQLQRFEGLLGPLPAHMIAASPRRDQFYETITDDDGSVRYKLRQQPEPQHVRTLPQVLERTQRRRQQSQQSQQQGGGTTTAAATTTTTAGGGDNANNDTADRYEQFMSLIKHLLEYDPAKRIGVLPAMEHAFLCEFMPYYLQRTAHQQQHQSGGGTTAASATTAQQPPPPAAATTATGTIPAAVTTTTTTTTNQAGQDPKPAAEGQ